MNKQKIIVITLAVCALIVGIGIVLFQKQLIAGDKIGVSPQQEESGALFKGINAQSGPLVRDNKGVTEISLSSAPQNVSQPDFEQLKEFRKRSEELERAVAELKKEKRENELVVRVGNAMLRADPLYTFEAQKQGLIGRERMADDEGMLYVFQMDDAGRLFGTKGMKFPIDIIWANNDLTVVHISKNVPPDFDGGLKSLWPARYVLEANAGYADRSGIRVGDTIDLGKIPH